MASKGIKTVSFNMVYNYLMQLLDIENFSMTAIDIYYEIQASFNFKSLVESVFHYFS